MPISNQSNNDASDPREAAAAKSATTQTQTVGSMRTSANPWSNAVLASRAAATGATDSPQAGGGIDPNTGEWSAHPSAPRVAGQTDGSGGYYGITSAAPTEGEGTANPYGERTAKGTSDRMFGDSPYLGSNPWSYMDISNMYGRKGDAAAGRTGPTIDTSQSTADRQLAMQARGNQDEAVSLQRSAAMGQVPSVAQIQQQNGMNAAIQSQMAMANSARGQGTNLAAAQRAAADNSAGLQANAINSSSLLRAQEMENARAGYLGATTQQRAQDLTQQGMSADQAYRQAQLEEQQRGLNDQTSLGYANLANQTLNSQLQADETAYKSRVGYATASQLANDQQVRDWQNKAMDASVSTMQSGASALTMSDIRAKTNVQPAGGSSIGIGMNASGPQPGAVTLSPSRPSLGGQNMVSEGTKTMPYLGGAQSAFGGMNPGGQVSVSEGTKVNSMPGNAVSNAMTPVPSSPGGPVQQTQAPYLGQQATNFQYAPSMSTAPTMPAFGTAMMSDENVKDDVRYADQDTYGKAKHNDYYRNDKVKSNAHWVSNDPATREAFRMRNEEFGYQPVMSDEHVKTAVHAAGHAKGYEAGYRAAIAQGNNPGRSNAYDAALAMGYKASSPAGMAMLGSGNGTNAQRNAAIDAELARIDGTPSASGMTSQRKAAADAAMARMAGTSTPQLQQDVINGRAVPPMTASPDTWDRLQNIRSGNIRQSDVNDELESMDGELPAPRAAAPAAYPVEPISSLHQAPYADYYEPADRGMSPMYKSRNEQDMGPLASSVMSDERVKASIQKDKRFPTGGPHVYEGTTSVDTRPSYTVKYDVDKSFAPGRDLMSDANVKTVDATPVYKEQYPDVVAKWKNENYDRAPAKDPKKFPMPVRPLGEVMSDEKAKMVRPGGETDADRFLESLQPFTFKYKSPDMEPTDSPTGGRYLGVMAQNVQKGPTGDTIVKQTPRGLALEGGALLSALSGGEGRLAERVSALEAQLAKSKKGK